MDLEFIERATQFLKNDVEISIKEARKCPARIKATAKFRQTDKYKQFCRDKYTIFKKACEGLTDEGWMKIREFKRNIPDGYEIDHIIPLSKGGLHRVDNLQYLTRSQNSSKGNRASYRSYYKI